jgi:hypothetical protein
VPVSTRSPPLVAGRGELRHVEARQQLAPDECRSHVRAVELVGRADEDVAIDRAHVHELVRREVHRIDVAERAGRVGKASRRGDVADRPERVRCGANRQQPRARRERRLECSPLELPCRHVERNRTDDESRVARHLPPRVDIRVVIELGDDDLVARLPGAGQGARQVEGERGHVGAKGNLVGRRAEEVAEGGARRGEHRVGFFAGRVRPVRVGVVVQEVVAHGVGNRRRHLRAAGAIEVGHRQTVVGALHGRKQRPNRLNRQHSHPQIIVGVTSFFMTKRTV